MLVFDFSPTALFWFGVAATAASIYLYAEPSLRAARQAASEAKLANGEDRQPLIGGAAARS